MRRALPLLCLWAATVAAQERDVQRSLLLRQQQSDEFGLQLRQSQERLRTSPLDPRQLQELERRQRDERQALENLDAAQQRALGLGGEADTARLIQERQRADAERRGELQHGFELRLPPPQLRAPGPAGPRP